MEDFTSKSHGLYYLRGIPHIPMIPSILRSGGRGVPLGPSVPKWESSAWGFAVGDGFDDAHPDVDQAEAADQSAHETQAEEYLERGEAEQQGVVAPQARPGKHRQNDADFQAEEYEHHQPKALQPD